MTSIATESQSSLPSASRSAQQVANLLRERIRSGQYSAGEWLPTERSLTDELHVHRRVVRTAIDLLVQEGLIDHKPHCRPVIAALPPIETEIALPTSQSASSFSPSRIVALVMWHGGLLEQGGTAQQRIFWGMNQALAKAGYHAVFLDLGETIGSETQNAEREAARLRYALDHGFGGVIFYAYAYQSNRTLIHEVSRKVPLCLIDRMLPGIDADFVGIQNYQGMYDATMHLIEQGHRRIAYITRSEPINPVQDRLQGYLHAMQSAFGSEADEMVLTAPARDMDTWTLFDIVFRRPAEERPTAVLTLNDYEAVKVTQRLAALNLRVPEDVVLIGFDDIVRALPGGVGLTTVAQPFEGLGRTAADTFLRRVESPSAPPAHIELPTRLVVRESSVHS